MEPWKDGGALYRPGPRGEGSGRACAGRWWVFITVGFEVNNEGRGDGMAPIYEGKGGGTGGASSRLHLSARGRSLAVYDVVASGEAAVARVGTEEGDNPWVGWLGRISLAIWARCINFQGKRFGLSR
jgi:hypothetical protein